MLRRTPFLLLLVLALGAVALPAQLPGTLFGSVIDENGDAIPGVKIVMSDPESDYTEEFETDKRGRYRIFVKNTNPPYDFTFSKDGYQPFTMPGIKVVARQNTRMNFDMRSMDSIQAQLAAPAADVPAEDVDAKGNYVKMYNEGVMALDAGNVGGAEALFREVLEKKEDYGPAYGGMARVHWRREQWDEAIAAATKSVELNPEDTEIDQVFYAAYSAKGMTAQANEVLARMESRDPEKAGKNLFNQAADLYNAGNMAEAKPILERVVANQPDNAKAHYMLGLCFINEGANDQAKSHLETFLGLAPNDPDAATAREMIGYLQ